MLAHIRARAVQAHTVAVENYMGLRLKACGFRHKVYYGLLKP